MSGWGGATPDEMLCAQADRDRCADVLKAAWVEGRLRDDEYRARLERVLDARTYGELGALVRDLPIGPHPFPQLDGRPQLVPSPGPQVVLRAAKPEPNACAVTSLVFGIVTLVPIWPATAVLMHGHFNPFPFAFAAVSLTTGYVGLHQARTRTYPNNGGSGLAFSGIALAWIVVVLALLAELSRGA
jgi:hypothetical protein